jgi:hypothetical protein
MPYHLKAPTRSSLPQRSYKHPQQISPRATQSRPSRNPPTPIPSPPRSPNRRWFRATAATMAIIVFFVLSACGYLFIFGGIYGTYLGLEADGVFDSLNLNTKSINENQDNWEPHNQVINVNQRSEYSNDYYAFVDQVSLGDGVVIVSFESHGFSDLQKPETSCIVEKPGFETIKPTSYDLPIREPKNYKGTLTYNFSTNPRSNYYFRYACNFSYSDVLLFYAYEVIKVDQISKFSDDYYAFVDQVYLGDGVVIVSFESHGSSNLNRPETSCIIERPSFKTIKPTSYDIPIQSSTNNKGTLTYNFPIQPGFDYYFRYNCSSSYSDAHLFNGNE